MMRYKCLRGESGIFFSRKVRNVFRREHNGFHSNLRFRIIIANLFMLKYRYKKRFIQRNNLVALLETL